MKKTWMAVLALSMASLPGCVIYERDFHRSHTYSNPRPGYYRAHRDRDHPRYPYYHRDRDPYRR
jgi:hypothetical protein